MKTILPHRFHSHALIVLTGALQGGVLWWLSNAAHNQYWPATQPVAYTALLYAAAIVPLVIYWTQKIDHLPAMVRWIAPIGYGLAFAALGGYSRWVAASGPKELPIVGTDVLAAAILGFVSLSLLCGFDYAKRRWNYAWLFNITWRNGIATATAAAVTGALWIVLFAGAALMKLIGIQWVMETLGKPGFALPVSCVVAALAFALGLERAGMIDAIRRFWLSISSWLLLLVLLFGVSWVAVIPFMGVEALFNTKSAALMLLWFLALAVKFANCAYQDGQVQWPYPRSLSRLTQLAWLSLLPVAAIAWWALGIRVRQYGWSEDRLWAGLVALLAAIYAIGYALSWFRPGRWMSAIGATNIAAAVVLCLGVLAFLSPVANVQRVAVEAHMSRIRALGGAMQPDWAYLRWDSGRFGRAALQSLAAGHQVPPGTSWVEQATRALRETSRHAARRPVLSQQEWAAKFTVYPGGKTLPASFLSQAGTREEWWEVNRCATESTACPIWMGDLNGDGVDEIVIAPKANGCCSGVFWQSANGWRRIGDLYPTRTLQTFHATQLEAARADRSSWHDLVVGEQRFKIHISQ